MKHLVLASAILGFAAAAAAQQAPASATPESQDAARQPVFRSGASLVALNVTVTDGKQFVAGLAQEDFAVYEDGVKQDVRFFEAGNVPIDLVLLIDTSASMRDKMPLVQEAARGFMKTMRTGDRGAVVEFNDTVTVGQALTGDRALIEAAINRTDAHGGTALNNALYIAIKQFGKEAATSGDIRRQTIAVLSDGQDTASLLSFDDVLGEARRSGVNIYTIALKSPYQSAAGSGLGFSESDYAMRTLARETGAQAFFPAKVLELKGIYALIAQELSNQYSIGYAPANPRVDGRFRKIVVRVTSRPGLTPRARSGYLAGIGSGAVIDDSTIR